jgi:RsiW-degrading membrane proteinase PrsW (M82 family)
VTATEALIHGALAVPAPALLGFAAWRANGGTRLTLAIMAAVLFAVFFVASFGLFCLGC